MTKLILRQVGYMHKEANEKFKNTLQNGWTQWLEELLPILLKVTEEHKEKIKDLTKVPTIDHQHEKITIMLLCTMLAPHHQTTKKTKPGEIKVYKIVEQHSRLSSLKMLLIIWSWKWPLNLNKCFVFPVP